MRTKFWMVLCFVLITGLISLNIISGISVSAQSEPQPAILLGQETLSPALTPSSEPYAPSLTPAPSSETTSTPTATLYSESVMPSLTSTPLLEPIEMFRLEILLSDPVLAEQMELWLTSGPFVVEQLNYTWGEHKGWYFPETNRPLKDIMQDFAMQHRLFLEESVMMESPVDEQSSASDEERLMLEQSRSKLLEDFSYQLLDFNEHGLSLSGAIVVGTLDSLRTFTETASLSNVQYRLTPISISDTKESTIADSPTNPVALFGGDPFPNEPWKFSPTSGYLSYDATSKYFKSYFYWTDVSGFSSVHRGYEHDIVLWKPKDTYVKPNMNGAFYSNLPAAYVDTPFMDNDSFFTIGSNWTPDISANQQYYVWVPVTVVNSNAGPATGDLQAQLSSWAGEYDDGDDVPEWQESWFCSLYGGTNPAYCLFRDQIYTIGNAKPCDSNSCLGNIYYNSSGAFTDFPFNHNNSVTYSWSRNYNPRNFSCPSTQFKGEYFSKTANHLPNNLLAIRCDSAVSFNWGEGSFIPGGAYPTDNFFARWTRSINFNAGNYRFYVRSDDGIRLWIDNTLVLDKWFPQGATQYSIDRFLTAGNHSIKIEYFESGGGAVAQFWYEQINASCPTITAWRGEYWNNTGLNGSTVLCRNDSSVNFNWGTGNPGGGINNDTFSARWTRTINLPAGNYRFYVRSDDGIRLWIDNTLVINKWIDQGSTQYSVDRNVSAGNHSFKIEYYENGGGAEARFWYEKIGAYCPTITGAKGEYWNNTSLSGVSSLCRSDSSINFNWGTGGPGSGVNTDNFSARWTGSISISTAGTYRFTLGGDDGVRLWVDGIQLINQWKDQGYTIYTADRYLSMGYHSVRVEYYERSGGARVYLGWSRLFSNSHYENDEELTNSD